MLHHSNLYHKNTSEHRIWEILPLITACQDIISIMWQSNWIEPLEEQICTGSLGKSEPLALSLLLRHRLRGTRRNNMLRRTSGRHRRSYHLPIYRSRRSHIPGGRRQRIILHFVVDWARGADKLQQNTWFTTTATWKHSAILLRCSWQVDQEKESSGAQETWYVPDCLPDLALFDSQEKQSFAD